MQALTEHPQRGADNFSLFSILKAGLNRTKDKCATDLENLSLVDLLANLWVQYDIHDLGKTAIPYSYPLNIAVDMWTGVDRFNLANNPDPEDVDPEVF